MGRVLEILPKDIVPVAHRGPVEGEETPMGGAKLFKLLGVFASGRVNLKLMRRIHLLEMKLLRERHNVSTVGREQPGHMRLEPRINGLDAQLPRT
jgi:hypothetical protein